MRLVTIADEFQLSDQERSQLLAGRRRVLAYRAALEKKTREDASHWHDITQRNLARCLTLLEQRRNP
jgi:hypothetical protein